MRRIWVVVSLAVVLCAASVAPAAAQTQIKKTVDRRFPAFLYCPIDPVQTLVFTAQASDAVLTFSTKNFSAGSWNSQALDNIAVVPQSVFAAHQLVTPGFDECYVSPGVPNTPGYDWTAAGTTETFLDLFDTSASGWDLGAYASWLNFNSAPRNPVTGADSTGGALGMGHTGDGDVLVTASHAITGLVPGTSYVVTGWWYTQNLVSLDIIIDFNPPQTLSVASASFGPQTTGTDFPSHDNGSLNGSGTFVSPLQLRNGSTLKSLSLVADIYGSGPPTPAVNARIYRVDSTQFGAGTLQVVATATVSGNTSNVPATVTTAFADVPVDLTRYDYFLSVQQDIDINTMGVRVLQRPPDPAASSTTSVAGLAFDPERTGIDFKTPVNGTLTSTGATIPGKFIAPIRLPHAATVTGLTLVARDNAATDATARLVRVPVSGIGGTNVAQVSTSGTGTAARTFTTSAITDASIDNSAYYYYLETDLPPTLNVYGVKVVYTGPPASPVFPADAIAGAAFQLNDAGIDQRNPVSNALAGQYRFDLGLDLPNGRQLTGFSMSVYDNSVDGDMNASLYKVDTTVSSGVGPQVMAHLQSTGSVDGQRVFSTDAIPGHAIDTQRYFYYVQLYTGFDPVRANGVTATFLPCGDNDGDGFNGCVNDCIDTRAAVFPGAAEVCDGVINNCNASFWPDPTGTTEGDDDFDGFSECQGDCADSDSTRWSPPGEVTNLQASHNLATGVTTLTWSAPSNLGSTTAPVYDTLRSTFPSTFGPPAFCSESNGTDLTTTFSTPAVAVGTCQFFAIRAEGLCGLGSLGTNSAGVPRLGRACP